LDPQLENDLRRLQSPWSLSGTLSGAAGYKDNVVLSSYSPQGSLELRGEAEMMAWRLPTRIADFVWFTSVSESLFPSIHGDGREEITALSHAELRYEIPGFFKASLAATGSYLDQVLDLSDSNAETLRLRARETLLRLTPGLHWKPLHFWWIDAEASLQASRFRGVPEDSDEHSAQLRLGRDFSQTQSAGLRLAILDRRYQERTQYTRGGRSLKGTRLSLRRPEAALFWKGSWGAEHRLTAELDAGMAWNRDNGSGFFDHDRAQASLKLNYKTGDWSLSLRPSAWRSLYRVQVAGEGFDPPKRRIEQSSLRLRAERTLHHGWTLLAELEAEQSTDNTPGGDYRSRGFLLGTEHAW
jgi:hypothetical protein